MRREFIEAARGYIGTPWHHCGRVKGRGGGVDCIGLACCAAKEIRYPFEDLQNYSRIPDGNRLVANLRRWLNEIPIGNQQPGDIGVAWVDPSEKKPQHIFIFTDYRGSMGMVHCRERVGQRNGRRGFIAHNAGSVIEHRLTDFWASRLCHVFRLKGAEPWLP